jgi:hypothetical protein
MPRTLFAVLPLLAASVLTASGCGGSTSSSTESTGQLTRSQLIAKADAICQAVNAKRASITIKTAQDFARSVPKLAADEHAAVEEMRKLTPPASMTNSWRQIVDSAQTIAYVTGRYRTYAQASNEKLVAPLSAALSKASQAMTVTANREGIRQCAQFQ